MTGTETPHRTTGSLIHWALGYDLLAWTFLGGRERAFRERLLNLARVQVGESVLDVGCGTGTLAIAAKRRVGATGAVFGIDGSREMIARASKKARKAQVDATFQIGIVEAIPFPGGRFDVVLNTLMLHHLPRDVRQQCANEMHRVLKPGGKVLAVDFAASHHRHGLLGHVHRHDYVESTELAELMRGASLEPMDVGQVGFRDLHFVLATKAG
jgi:ubiquinone/menaquinone biosynthesis C-methylase UbiE